MTDRRFNPLGLHPPHRFRVGLLLGLVGATTATMLVAQPSPSERKRGVDTRLERARERLDATRRRESVLTDEVAAYSSRIRATEALLGPIQVRLEGLEGEVARLEARLRGLGASLERERRRLAGAELRLAQGQRALANRLREIYRLGKPDPILALLQSGSVTDAVATTALMQRITARDGDLVASTERYARSVRNSRDAIKASRDEVLASERRAEAAATELQQTTRDLTARRDELKRLQDGRRALLARVQGDRADIEAEARDLQRRSTALAARIVRAQASSTVPIDSTISSRGMVSPVSGTITSGFGMRWGRMHEGLDIAAPTGTPVVAAASGRVISAGWGGGYGNLVVVDHGGGLATAYAHNSRVAVSPGQAVGQGTVIAYAGSTGRSTGPHLHFEVRVNGAARDPIPYL